MDNPSRSGRDLVKSDGGAATAALFKTGNDEIDRLPISTQVWFNDQLYDRVTKAATIMAKAEGFVSKDLLNKTETCFAVVLTAFDAGLSPFEVARGAFQTPEGKVGYDTRVIQSIVEAKGFFTKPPKLDYTGPWDTLIGKFKKEKSDKGKWYTVKTWTASDAKGCKLRVTFFFRDLAEPVVCEEMDLSEVGTHFSTQWATEPKAQFARLVVRRQLQLKRPSILAGVPCIDDLLEQEQPMKEINPRPEKDGNAGLDDFAGTKPSETVVEDEPDTEAKSADSDAKKPAENAGAEEPVQDNDAPEPDKPETVTVWISADEPEREFKDLPAAAHVLRSAIKGAKTQAMAQSLVNQNIGLICQIDQANGSKKYSEGVEMEVLNKENNGGSSGNGEEGQLL